MGCHTQTLGVEALEATLTSRRLLLLLLMMMMWTRMQQQYCVSESAEQHCVLLVPSIQDNGDHLGIVPQQ